MTTASHRLFLALAPDHETRQALTRLRARSAPHLEDVHWVPRDNWHITLHFLGACSPALKTRLAQAFMTQADDFKPLSLAARQLQGFPEPNSPSRIWALTLDADPALIQWHVRLGQWLESFGIALEKRALKGHLTLARSARKQHWPLHAAPLNCRFDKLALYESVATPQGPCYQSLSAVGTSA